MLESVKIARRQSEIRQNLAELAGKETPSKDEIRQMDTLDLEYRSNETRYRASLIAEDTERRDAGSELETRSGQEWADLMAGFEMRQVALALDEGRQLDGQTAEIVQELRSEGGFAMADVTGTNLLTRQNMAMIARAVALNGDVVFLITELGLVPATDWDVTTRDGRPRAYRLSLPEAGGGRTHTALAAEVLHLRIGSDNLTPWIGSAPLRRSSLTGAMLHAVESALSETFENAPLGSLIVPLPDTGADDMASMRGAFKGRRGSTLVIEGVAQATAAGMNPTIGQKPDQLSPDLSKSMTAETLAAAREGIGMAYGVLPSFFNRAATGPVIREAQRQLAIWTLQPIAAMLADEATAKLGAEVTIDTIRPLQAFDAGGRARALSAIIKTLAEAKEAGIPPADVSGAMRMVDWKE